MTHAPQPKGHEELLLEERVPDTSSSLLGRLRAGEEAAFEELVRGSSSRLLGLARRMLRNEEAAQDALQEAYLSAFRSLPRFDGRSLLSTWLHRIVVNTCLMRMRAQRSRPDQAIDTLLPEFLEDGHHAVRHQPWRDVDAQVQEEETRAFVRACIDELPASYREVLMLRDMEELSTEETGAALGMTVAAVKTRLHRARQALRTLLAPRFAPGEVSGTASGSGT